MQVRYLVGEVGIELFFFHLFEPISVRKLILKICLVKTSLIMVFHRKRLNGGCIKHQLGLWTDETNKFSKKHFFRLMGNPKIEKSKFCTNAGKVKMA